MAVFQVVFGLLVFGVTRQYYLSSATSVSVEPVVQSQSWPVQKNSVAGNSALINSSTFGQATSREKDPDAIAFQADDLFANKEYALAADLYEQLLEIAPDNVDTYNNLGITLHYIGKSTEAVEKLNQGIEVDPKYQRIWLTLGYVNGQIGNIEQARTALTTAVQIDANNDVGQSATKMLENLP